MTARTLEPIEPLDELTHEVLDAEIGAQGDELALQIPNLATIWKIWIQCDGDRVAFRRELDRRLRRSGILAQPPRDEP